MAGKLDLEARMTIKTLKERGTSASSIAQTLGVTEGAVRYHLRRQVAGAVDGRAGSVKSTTCSRSEPKDVPGRERLLGSSRHPPS